MEPKEHPQSPIQKPDSQNYSNLLILCQKLQQLKLSWEQTPRVTQKLHQSTLEMTPGTLNDPQVPSE